jgi:Tfp pilus assembly protein PilE
MNRVRGFTLLEQSIVIASIGALSAVALPRMLEWRSAAEVEALSTLAATLGTQMLVNRGACLMHSAADRPDVCATVSDCGDAHVLMHHPLPPIYELHAQPLPGGAQRSLGAECRVSHRKTGEYALFRGYSTTP